MGSGRSRGFFFSTVLRLSASRFAWLSVPRPRASLSGRLVLEESGKPFLMPSYRISFLSSVLFTKYGVQVREFSSRWTYFVHLLLRTTSYVSMYIHTPQTISRPRTKELMPVSGFPRPGCAKMYTTSSVARILAYRDCRVSPISCALLLLCCVIMGTAT